MDVEEEEEEVLFAYTSTPPPPSYYVQSPSTTISNTSTFEFQPGNHHIHIHELSPDQYPTNKTKTNPSQHQPELASGRTTFSSSRCSSNRDSLMSNASNSFPHSHENKLAHNKRSIVKGKHGDGDDDNDSKIGILGQFGSTHDGYEKDAYGGSFRKYLSFGTYDGSMWLALQLSWRLMVSLAVALLVFYVVTKPPPPHISVKVGGVREFELAEGVDGSGVSTKIMRCNTSIEVLIENHSKVCELHLLPPVLRMSFQHLTFAVSKGGNLVADRQHVTNLEMYLGARSKPMYGAGRMMQDMLDSKDGLPLVVDVSLVSNYRVVAGLIRPWYRHHARCLLVIKKGYDSKHRTHHFNTTCAVLTSK